MSWVAVAVTAGTTALGAYQGAQKEKAQKRHNLAAAEANRYSPWTGRSYSQDFSNDGAAFGGGLQGAVTGLMLGQNLRQGMNRPGAKAGGVASGDPTSGGPMTGTGNTSGRMWTSDMMKRGPRTSFY